MSLQLVGRRYEDEKVRSFDVAAEMEKFLIFCFFGEGIGCCSFGVFAG